MKRKNWLVADYGIRPKGKPDECFYCGAKIADEHNKGCVIRSRTVVVERTITMVTDVPEDWNDDDINSHYEGTHCADNIINDLKGMLIRFKENGRGCLCGIVSQKYIREATEKDEQEHHFHVMKLPS